MRGLNVAKISTYVRSMVRESRAQEEDMTEVIGQTVHFTQLEDGTFLAASISRPWFAVSGATLEDARTKAERALGFHSRVTPTPPIRHAKTITPFSTVRVEHLSPAPEAARG